MVNEQQATSPEGRPACAALQSCRMRIGCRGETSLLTAAAAAAAISANTIRHAMGVRQARGALKASMVPLSMQCHGRCGHLRIK